MENNSNNPLSDQLPTQNEIYQSHNNNVKYNNEQTPSNYNPPPIYDNNIPQEINQDNNNNEGRLSSLEAPPAYDNYQPLDVKAPLSYPSQTNIKDNNSNIYDKPINHPLNISSPQSIKKEQIPQDTKLEVKEPVYQLQVVPQQQYYNINNRPCCQECCNKCCDDCQSCCDDCCDSCCKNINWSACAKGFGSGLGKALSNLKI